jgi:hypothetical protein
MKNGIFTHRGLPLVTFTHKGVLVELNGPGVVFIETRGARHSCGDMDHQHGS